MAEQHRHELIPTGEAAGMSFGLLLSGELLELRSGKDLEDLLEDAAYSVHRWGPSCTSFCRAKLNCTGPGDSRHAGRADLRKLIWTGVNITVEPPSGILTLTG